MLGHLPVTHDNNNKFSPWDNTDFVATMIEISRNYFGLARKVCCGIRVFFLFAHSLKYGWFASSTFQPKPNVIEMAENFS